MTKLWDMRSARYDERYQSRYGVDADGVAYEPCFVCGKKTREDKGVVIEITWEGYLVPDDVAPARNDSQGCFLVGPKCAHLLAKAEYLPAGHPDLPLP